MPAQTTDVEKRRQLLQYSILMRTAYRIVNHHITLPEGETKQLLHELALDVRSAADALWSTFDGELRADWGFAEETAALLIDVPPAHSTAEINELFSLQYDRCYRRKWLDHKLRLAGYDGYADLYAKTLPKSVPAENTIKNWYETGKLKYGLRRAVSEFLNDKLPTDEKINSVSWPCTEDPAD
jgi:hypothetical protein